MRCAGVFCGCCFSWSACARQAVITSRSECTPTARQRLRPSTTIVVVFLCVQVHPRNSGRDPFPVFLRRGPLPREKPRGQTLTGRIPKSLCYRYAAVLA